MKLSRSKVLLTLMVLGTTGFGVGGVYWLLAKPRHEKATEQTFRDTERDGSATPVTPNSESPSAGTPKAASTERRLFPFRRVVAIVIGINNYPHLTGTANLACAESDARSVGDLLDRHYGYQIVPLLGAQATKAAIETAIQKNGRELGERDALVVYFAGHGQVIELAGHGEAGYLIPADARLDLKDARDASRWAEQAIDMQQLTAQMEEATAQHTVFIADACCSGYMTARGSLERWDLKNFLTGKSRTVITATNRRQLAREDATGKHGYFTAALLNELSKTDAASVLDIYYPLSRVVPEKVNGNMQPQFAQFGEGTGMFVFIPMSIPKEEIESDLNAENATLLANRNAGVAGVINRAANQAKQKTTYAEFLAALAATEYRFAVNAEEQRQGWEQKFARYHRNALMGDVWAMAALCCCYEKGLGVEKDLAQVVYWARQANRVRQSPGVGSYLIGYCYNKGYITPNSEARSKEQAKRLFAESAMKGFGPAQLAHAGNLYGDGTQLSRDQRQAVYDLLEKAVAEGVLLANVELGLCLLEDNLRSADAKLEARAIQLLESAASKGFSRAHFFLSQLYSGQSVRGKALLTARDFKKARSHLLQACEAGHATALLGLGTLYFTGDANWGIAKDLPRAFEFFEQAGELGEATALCLSALMLADGSGGIKDPEKAKARLEQAVKYGAPESDFMLGKWYQTGKVYQRSDEQALAAFRRGADKGHAGSCFHAGLMYLKGEGFKAKWQSEGGFHTEWHMGLHYFVESSRSGQPDAARQTTINKWMLDFTRYLEGGAFSKEIDQALNTNPSSVDAFGPKSPPGGNKQGSRGQRQEIVIHSGISFSSLRGNLIVEATQVAKQWRTENPDSFKYFCSKWGVDPDSLEVKEKAAPKQKTP
ncbi:Beta-lactamase HcpA precursor [Gemmata obscuriglobus]|uniref:Peptidase C14 caspase domain-containing protein n=1 Tax=Gemmata obscuriglobus TaxID=114 RepID=A0A2Z3H458_9BACT|nr:caspase family protein [Gemmata obscuriglobus]AWM39112.1 hypothetical protein C1280_20410 [Gemmata obscuriglobus]QEG27847.1 Beta-lactamase HcpA precursor [Gemmata obscuriglobus]VTS05220.1 sel1 repeat protein : Uncharacterized protein OS=Amoebophilus asiaticus (strain 5a2) GN=Aasi_0854 PE=4 SV=1: Peptidase_C14: Sel1: Sel1: Sel1: Sel1: Sel1: Sel1: Sel1 [Gemmata obscuriglobus UQM 2246]